MGHGEVLVRVDQVEQVVRHGGSRLGTGLRRPDVHAAVDAHGIDGDDLAVAPAQRQLQGGVRFPRGRDPDECDRSQALATGISTRCRGRATTSSRRPERWCGWPSVTITRANAPGAGVPAGVPPGKWISFPCRVRPVSMDASLPADAFDQGLLAAADARLVPGQGGAVHHRLEALETLGDDVRRHEAGLHVSGSGAGTRREDEGVRAVVLGLGAQRERGLEVVLRLTGEAHDDVGRHRQVGDGGARRGEPLEVARRGVPAPHGAQHPVAPGLQGQVQLLADLGRLRHGLDRLGPQILGVRTGEADAPDALHRADLAQQLGEEGSPLRDVAAVGVHVLPEQRHLGDPAAGQHLHLRHDVVEGAARLRAPHRRDDAERAGVVTSGLNVDPRRVGQLPNGTGTQQRVVPRLGRRCVEDLHDGALGLRPAQEPGRAGQVVGAEDDVDPAHLLLNPLPVLLGQAAADGNLEPGLGVHQLLEAAQRPVEPLVGVLPDAARVEHDHIRLLHGGGGRQPIGHEQPGEPLGVVLVHLAPEGTDEIGPGHPRESREQGRLDFRRWIDG